jgi:hypothetical protein
MIFRVVPNGMMSIQNFIQIRIAVHELNHTERHDGQTDMISSARSFQSRHAKNDVELEIIKFRTDCFSEFPYFLANCDVLVMAMWI